MKDLIELEIEAIRNIPENGSIDHVVDLIYEHVHLKKAKLIVSGMGKAGHIGYNIAMTFASTGTPSVFLHPSEAQHGDLGMMQENDIFLLISNSGKTREILELCELIRKMSMNNKIVCITNSSKSILSENSEITILTGNPKEVCPLGLTPTVSTTVMTVIGDILVVKMMKKINFTKEEYSKRHHGGYLGQKAKE